MGFLVYIIVGILLIIVLAAIIKNPMDDSREEFNANIFPLEIKDPKEWCKSKDKKSNSQNKK